MKLDKEKTLQLIQEEMTQEDIDYLVSLDEMSTVGRSTREKLLIQVNPAEKEGGNAPYFKVFNSANEPTASQVARIRFHYPIYEIHARKWNRGKDYWWLNSRDKSKLIAYLEADNTNFPQFTNWKAAILAFNNERGLDYEKTQQNLLSKMPLKYPDFIPFDLPMPDYELLAPNKDVNKRIKDAIEGLPLAEAQRIAKRILDSLM